MACKIQFFLIFFYRFKQAINPENIERIIQFCESASAYINSLSILKMSKAKIPKLRSQPIMLSSNKAGFRGFSIVLANIPKMYERVVKELPHVVDTGFQTYYLLQDSIEFFFGTVRRRIGCNHNPSTLEFRAAFRRVPEINAFDDNTQKKGNCQRPAQPPQHTFHPILKPIDSSEPSKSKEELLSNTGTCAEYYARLIYDKLPTIVLCCDCCKFLSESFLTSILDMCEKEIRNHMYSDNGKIQYKNFDNMSLISMITQSSHSLDLAKDENPHFNEKTDHYDQAINAILQFYIKERRIYYLGKLNEKKSVRNKLTRVIIHKHM